MSAEVEAFFNEQLPQRLSDPSVYEGINSVYQFNIENSGHWWVDLQDGQPAKIEAGTHENSHVVIDVEAEDWKAILAKELDPTMAFMQQKLRVDGNMALALKLQTFLND